MNKKEIKKLYEELKTQYKLAELPIGNEEFFVQFKGETVDGIFFVQDININGDLHREQGLAVFDKVSHKFIDKIIESIEI